LRFLGIARSWISILHPFKTFIAVPKIPVQIETFKKFNHIFEVFSKG
jgi:hypothetical protein